MADKLPRGVFGEVKVSHDTPVIQLTAAYLTTAQLDLFTSDTGTAGAADSKFFCTTGTGASAFSSAISKRPLIYKAGQGAKFRGTARFVNPQPGNLLFVGLLNVENRIGFAYLDGVFGILYQRHGAPAIQELQVTTPAAGAETATVTLEGIAYSVPLTATTAQQNAIEIANSLNTQQDLYDAAATGDTVVVRRILSGPNTGAFLFSSATAVAVWTEIVAGKAFESEFIPQSSWNRKPNRTVITDNLTPFEIRYQYLGGGVIDFGVENSDTGKFDVVHRIEYPGTEEITSVSNPSYRAGIIAVNFGNTTDSQIESGSIGTFIEGFKSTPDVSRGASNTVPNVVLTPLPIISIRNRLVFDGKVAETEIVPTLIISDTDSAKPIQLTVYKNIETSIPLVYEYVDKGNSIAEISTDQQTITGGEVITACGKGSIDMSKVIKSLLPGETLTIAINNTSAAGAEMVASINWQEDFA